MAPDTFTRVICSVMTSDDLVQLHNSLCHPGITRMAHFVKTKNLRVSIEQIRSVVNSCPTYAECKPRFYRPTESHLIKATQPFEILDVDFKSPLPSNKGLVIKYGGGGPAEIGGGSSSFKLTKRGGSPKYWSCL